MEQKLLKEIYQDIRVAANHLDAEIIAAVFAANKGASDGDIEHSMMGGANHSLFYYLLFAFNDAVNNACGNTDKVDAAVQSFRKCYTVLYENGVRPDVECLAEWNALSTGYLKDPAHFEISDANFVFNERSRPGKEDHFTADNIRYPFQMPYLSYTPVQRLMFDEFCRYLKFADEHKDVGQTKLNYDYERIKNAALLNKQNIDGTVIQKKAEVGELNIRLTQRFDYFYKNFIASRDANRMSAYPYFKPFGETELNACVSYGLAMTSPSCMYVFAVNDSGQHEEDKMYNVAWFFNLKFDDLNAFRQWKADELLKAGEEYLRFKKSFFVDGNPLGKFKSNEEIAQLPYPSYLRYLTDADLPIIEQKFRDENINSGKSVWADKRNPAEPFRWLDNLWPQVRPSFFGGKDGKLINSYMDEKNCESHGISVLEFRQRKQFEQCMKSGQCGVER